jgi:hypothetical protein
MTMSNWQLNIPHTSRSDPLAELPSLARQAGLGEEDRAVVRELVLEAFSGGARTAGDLLDRLDAAELAERRAILDRARIAAGLPSTSDAEAHARYEAANRVLAKQPHRDADGKVPQACAVCGSWSTTREGARRPVAAARWHCPGHEHLAEPGDMEPPKPSHVLDPATMALVPVGEEAERLEREDREQREEWARRTAERQAEAERRAAVAKARHEAARGTAWI